MAYKSISTVVTDAAIDKVALQTALALADRLEAHLDVWCLAVDESRYEPMPAGSAAILLQENSAQTRQRADELASWAESLLPQGNFKIGVEPLVMPHLGIDSGLAGILRYSDLIVSPRPYGDGAGPLQVQIVEAGLFVSAVPSIVVPPGGGLSDLPRRVAIAWDSSDEAMMAIRKALPILQTADLVSVVMVDPPRHSPDRSDPGGEIAQYLARHGVHTQVSIISRTMPRISDCLLRFAEEHDADMLVMGAYGHSRVREALIGGPTRHMLQDARLPILMAH